MDQYPVIHIRSEHSPECESPPKVNPQAKIIKPEHSDLLATTNFDSHPLTPDPTVIPKGVVKKIEMDIPLPLVANVKDVYGRVKPTSELTQTFHAESPTVMEGLIREAANNNRPKALEALFNIGSLDKSLLTELLQSSAKKGQWDCACILIKNGADINAITEKINIENFKKLIITSVKNNDSDVLEKLFNSNFSLDESLKPLLTELLLYSIEKGQWDCARVLIKNDLIKNDADINMKVIEKLKKHIAGAVKSNDSNVLEKYLNFCNFINFCDYFDCRFKSLLTEQLLHLIENLESENLECACVLIKNGAQVILTEGGQEIIGPGLLVTDNEDEYPAAEMGKRLFMCALRQEHKEIIQILIDNLIKSGYASQPFLGGHPVLSLAVINNKKDSVEIIMQAFYNAGLNPNDYINIPNNADETPLMLAVRNEDEEMIRLLLRIKRTDEEVPIQACIAAAWIAADRILLEAVKQGNEAMIEMLLKRAEANPTLLNKFLNECDEEGNTVFTLAAASQKKHIEEVIIQATGQATGMNPNDFKILSETGQTPFMLAAMRGDVKSVELMIEGTDPTLLQKLFSHLDKNGDNVFAFAAKNGKKNTLKSLILTLNIAKMNLNDFMISSNKNGETPLMLAAKNGDKESVELIIKGVDNSGFLNTLLSERDVNGNNVFALAAGNGDILEVLIQACIAVDGIFLEAVNQRNEGMIKLLLERAETHPMLLHKLLNERDKEGNTVLALAARNGNENIIKMIIQAPIATDMRLRYFNVKNEKGETPLMLAAVQEGEKIVRLLLTEAGVDRNVWDNNRHTALMLAALYRKWEIVRILSEDGANFSDMHILLEQLTGQHGLEIENLTDLAKELIANGASLKTAKKISKIKKIANVWGLTENYTIKDEMGRNVTFRLEGYSGQFMLQIFINYVNKFYESMQHNQHNLTVLKDNQMAVRKSIENALFESSSDIDFTIKSSPLLVLLCGWTRHSITMVIDHTKKNPELMICNRGGSYLDDHGNVIVDRYAFSDASHINETTIKNLTKKYNNPQEFADMISGMISRKILEEVPPDYNFVQKLQKAGNCGWANTKGALPLILRMCISKTTGELVRTLVEKKDYKEFSAWVRAEALEELLLSNPPRDLVLQFLEKYIIKLFGQNIPYGEGGIIRSVKEIIEEIESPDNTSEIRIDGIKNLISLLETENMQTEQAKRQGMQRIRALFETWLKGLRDEMLSEAAQEKRS